MRKADKLPNLIVIGAMKCGTTSLHYYLGLHPEIWMSREKEINFFVAERNWPRGLDWYRSHFRTDLKIRGETTPAYTAYPVFQGVPERMHSVLPDARLIYIVRDPIDRIISHYVQNYSTGYESRSIQEALFSSKGQGYLINSRYGTQLERYLEQYSMDRILVLTLEELERNRRNTLRRVFSFLGVDPDFFSEAFSRVMHSSEQKGRKNRIGRFLKLLAESRPARIFPTVFRMRVGRILYLPFSRGFERPVLSDDLKGAVAERLTDDTQRFRKLTGRSFSGWSV